MPLKGRIGATQCTYQQAALLNQTAPVGALGIEKACGHYVVLSSELIIKQFAQSATHFVFCECSIELAKLDTLKPHFICDFGRLFTCLKAGLVRPLTSFLCHFRNLLRVLILENFS